MDVPPFANAAGNPFVRVSLAAEFCREICAEDDATAAGAEAAAAAAATAVAEVLWSGGGSERCRCSLCGGCGRMEVPQTAAAALLDDGVDGDDVVLL